MSIADALAQVAAGAQMLDINAGIPLADEPAMLAKAIQLVQAVTDVPLSIDSSIVEALGSRPAVYQGKALLNSVTGEEANLERVLPLSRSTARQSWPFPTTKPASPKTPTCVLKWPSKIVRHAADYGIPASDIVVDPLVMPIGAMGTAGQQVFALLRRLRDELKVNTTCGASNISFGLPNRNVIGGTFLAMAMSHGMTSAIMNPLHAEVKHAIQAADVLCGHDPNCAHWIRHHRDPGNVQAGESSGRRGGRRARVDERPDRLIRVCPPLSSPRLVAKATLRSVATVLDAARDLGVDLDSVCGGRGICGRCQVVPTIRRVRQARDHQQRRPSLADRA